MKTFLSYSLKGLLFLFPLVATGYIIFRAVAWANTTFNDLLFEWMSVNIPGLGIIAVFLLISLTGWMVSLCMTWPVFRYIENLFRRMPLVRIIYTSVKELTEAFVGDEKKFNIPVVYEFNDSGLMRFGFVTQENLQPLELDSHVAVYSPHSYNFSGNLYLVPKNKVQRIEANSAELMKYIISAGVTSYSKTGGSDKKTLPK